MALKNKEYQALNDRVIALVKEGMPKNEMDEIISISKSIEELDDERTKQLQSYSELQKDYINAFKNAPVSNKDNSEPRARTLEEIIADIKKGK